MSNLQMPTIASYDAAERAYRNAPPSGRIGHNTVITKEAGGIYLIRYHNNPIVGYEPDGSIHVSNAGWASTTTNNRINLIVGQHCRAYRKDWQAYVTVGDTTYPLGRGWIEVAKVLD
jgi:hypothetical protein